MIDERRGRYVYPYLLLANTDIAPNLFFFQYFSKEEQKTIIKNQFAFDSAPGIAKSSHEF
jgi:hypothetical protein